MHGKSTQGERRGGGVTPTHSKLRLEKEADVQHHAMAALTLGPVAILQETGWVSGSVWTARKISPPQGFDHQNLHVKNA